MGYFHVLLIKTYAAHKKRSRDAFYAMDLTAGQPKVLSILENMEGCQQKELAEACAVEPPTMTVLLKNMEQKGLIYREKRQLPGGFRAYGIYLTEAGKQANKEVMKIVDEAEDVAFKGFTDKEKEAFMAMFSRVRENLEDVYL
ncbi:MAG: MarR family transcriptional regulator [Lachnospiraceae bacterium]|nr:MarR family transcriptional regulator [Lachnospiraceae bacterium]